jgi:hypothetical protein
MGFINTTVSQNVAAMENSGFGFNWGTTIGMAILNGMRAPILALLQ